MRASEAVAASYLESMGFKIIEVHKKVSLGGVDVSDVDIVAEKDNVMYAIEVKSGAVDVDAIRQAYANAKVLGMKPAVVGRGLADERASALAKELGVEVYLLSDLLVVQASELRDIVYEAVYSALNDLLSFLASCVELRPEDERVVEALATSSTILSVAEKLGVSEQEAAKLIASLSERGVLPRGSIRVLSLASKAILLCRNRLSSTNSSNHSTNTKV